MHKLPLARYAIREIQGDARFVLQFDDPERSSLWLEGTFVLRSEGWEEAYRPPCPPWVRDVLAGLIAVEVTDARYRAQGSLLLSFADGRSLFVSDGPYENWHYSNMSGMRVVGGVGRVVAWDRWPGHKQ